MSFTNKGYDALKFIALILLPALGALYAGVAGIWNLPNVDKVNGTVLAVDAFLGVILHLSSNPAKAPTDGTLTVVTNPDGSAATGTIEFTTHPAALIEKPAANIRVVRTPSTTVGAPQPGPTPGL